MRAGTPIDLRPREFALLEYLMRHAGHVVSKTMILSHVWEYNFDPQTNVVDVLVSRLREKIDRPFEKKLLHTVRRSEEHTSELQSRQYLVCRLLLEKKKKKKK